MAKETKSRCSVCGASVGPGVRFCCHFCKFTFKNVEARQKRKAKPEKAKPGKKPTDEKAK